MGILMLGLKSKSSQWRFQKCLKHTIVSIKLLPDRISSPILPVIYDYRILESRCSDPYIRINWAYILEYGYFGTQSVNLFIVLAFQVV